jgi:hypothetical protein
MILAALAIARGMSQSRRVGRRDAQVTTYQRAGALSAHGTEAHFKTYFAFMIVSSMKERYYMKL